MTVTEILEKAHKSGVKVREKSTEPGHYSLTKKGMADLEVFNVLGHTALIIDTQSRYPAQVSTDNWTDIIFPV